MDQDRDDGLEMARLAQPTRSSIRALARELPEDVGALFASATDLGAQVHLALAAAARGTPLPLDALRPLIADVPRWESVMGLLAGRDDRHELLQILVEAPWTSLEHRACAVALLLHDPGDAETVAARMELRQMLRAELPSLWHDELVLATARRLREEDPAIGALYERATAKMPELHPEAIAMPGRLAKQLASFDLALLPEHLERTAAVETPKAGRNDPCPCGSGKKFKKCCGAPGAAPKAVTPSAPTAETMAQQPIGVVARLPFDALDDATLTAAMTELLRGRHLLGLERMLPVWVARELSSELKDSMILDALVILSSVGGSHGALSDSAPPDRSAALDAIASDAVATLARDVVASSGPRTADDWRRIEGACRAGLGDPPAVPLDVAATLLHTHPGIAAFLLRGVAIDAHPRDAELAAGYVALARDLLGAPPDDPLLPVLRLLDKDDARTDAREARVAEAQAARAALEEQLAELRAAMRRTRAESERLAEELDAERSALAALEAADADDSSPAVDPEELRRLRGKVRELKGRIEEGKVERTKLREQVDRATEHATTEEAATPEPEEDDAPEDLDTSGEPSRLRVPEWSARARKALAGLPASIAQHAVVLAAQLATGDPLARRGAKKLEGFENLRRARVGIHYRLLYVLHESTLEVVDVLARENLDSHLGRYRKSIG